eukprot:scaffold552_cov526-Prasinococcus_capsulatus_cf.AAC.4
MPPDKLNAITVPVAPADTENSGNALTAPLVSNATGALVPSPETTSNWYPAMSTVLEYDTVKVPPDTTDTSKVSDKGGGGGGLGWGGGATQVGYVTPSIADAETVDKITSSMHNKAPVYVAMSSTTNVSISPDPMGTTAPSKLKAMIAFSFELIVNPATLEDALVSATGVTLLNTSS